MIDPRLLETDTTKDVAYLLLVELLAYQFASPVRWIETQDVLLRQLKCENFVEIGPADVLTGMLKKTLQVEAQSEAILGLERKLFNIDADQSSIYRGLTTEEDILVESTEDVSKTTPISEPTIHSVRGDQPAQAPMEAQITSVTAQALLHPAMDDVPVCAKDVVLTIIANKNGKPLGTIAMDKSIKQLAGGRSILENEIIGDLEAEFESMPEQAETMALQTLCDKLQGSNFSNQLGKVTRSAVAKMAASRMPGGFTEPQIRDHLQQRWGLGPGRQDTVLLRGSAEQPKSRLASEPDAEEFWNLQAKMALQAWGLQEPNLVQMTTKPGVDNVTIHMTEDNHGLETSQTRRHDVAGLVELDSRARSLGIDINAASKLDDNYKDATKLVLAELESLKLELGSVFVEGILSHWAPEKAREFDSSWNWTLQDMLTTYHSILSGELTRSSPAVVSNLEMLPNRSFPGLATIAHYLRSQNDKLTQATSVQAVQYLDHVLEVCMRVMSWPTIDAFAKRAWAKALAPKTTIDEKGKITYTEVERPDSEFFQSLKLDARSAERTDNDHSLTSMYHNVLRQALGEVPSSLTMAGKNVLLTGAGPDSIGSLLLIGLLSSGANVVVTTSSFSSATARVFEDIYREHGSRGSKLTLVPFNQSSVQDIESLAEWIYSPSDGLGIDLDHIIPFAAMGEAGREVSNIDSKSELTHRMMLTNVYRLLGAVIKQKMVHNHYGRMTQALIPLSPNHGIFGGDGLYSESKIGLEALLARWSSESWSDHMSICGAAIGWTRSTGMMKQNDPIAEGIEHKGVQTFTQNEMALYLLALMSRLVAEVNETTPIHADLSGGMSAFSNLKSIVSELRLGLNRKAEIRFAVSEDHDLDALEDDLPEDAKADQPPEQQANLGLEFPVLHDYQENIAPLASQLEGMHDLGKVAVITGFGEVSPFGSARTRWEMEAKGQFSLEGCIELAWVMGFIRFHDGDVSGKHYVGWLDTKTSQPISDVQVKQRYEADILAHTGIRLVEESLDIGYDKDPTRQRMLHEVILTEDMPMMTVTEEIAANLKVEHGAMVDTYEQTGPSHGEVRVRMKKGATILVPKALEVPHAIAGQIPTGWSAKTYGIPDEIVDQVDRVTLFALVSVAEALMSSGLTDAYELYRYIHVSDVANCIGSGLGGLHALKDIFRSRHHDMPVQADVLQETFVNTPAAWVNMLLISGAGAIRTPVGACATALESLESGCELISSGKARFCLVGGVDDMDQAIADEFANMGATVDPGAEANAGRAPHEASRPATSSRKGFVESHGCGVQVLVSARLALDMGLPIQAIVAMANTSSDKAGRSIPAPGQGILGNARERPGKSPSPMLSLKYRRRQLQMRQKQINESMKAELQFIEEGQAAADVDVHKASVEEQRQWIHAEAQRQHREALANFNHRFWNNDASISPIRGALSTWGLDVDDLDFASFHGTSTVKNDLNETGVIQRQLEHLGRSKGNVLYSVFQKYLTGHSKGAAAAWMLNGSLQILQSGLVPGQRNADNIDSKLQERSFLFYPSKAIQTQGLKAFTVTSFGFGQKGAQAICVHPRYLFASINEHEYEEYCGRATKRARKASQAFTKAVALESLCLLKSTPPWETGKEEETLLDPTKRL